MVAAITFQTAWFALTKWLVQNDAAVVSTDRLLAAMGNCLAVAQRDYEANRAAISKETTA